jgi:transcriptional regulator with XRE-family HTH domain
MRRHVLDIGRPLTTADDPEGVGPNGLTSDAMGDVGVTLRRLRVRLRWTQEELSERAGVGQKTISQIETGHRASPSPIVIGKLDAALEAGGALLETLERARDDRAGWQAVLGQLEAISQWLAQLEAGQAAIVKRLDAGGEPAEELRQWMLTMAAYGEAMTDAERATLTTLARTLADRHALPPPRSD